MHASDLTFLHLLLTMLPMVQALCAVHHSSYPNELAFPSKFEIVMLSFAHL